MQLPSLASVGRGRQTDSSCCGLFGCLLSGESGCDAPSTKRPTGWLDCAVYWYLLRLATHTGQPKLSKALVASNSWSLPSVVVEQTSITKWYVIVQQPWSRHTPVHVECTSYYCYGGRPGQSPELAESTSSNAMLAKKKKDVHVETNQKNDSKCKQ